MLKNKQDAIRLLMSPFQKPMRKIGITESYLAKKLKAELCAKKIEARIPTGEKEFAYSKPLVAWDIRQKARMDAHKLRGDYPPEEHDLNFPGGPVEFKVIFDKGKGNGSGET